MKIHEDNTDRNILKQFILRVIMDTLANNNFVMFHMLLRFSY